MTQTHSDTPINPPWASLLANASASVPASAWRLMYRLSEDLYRHNLKTGWVRLRLGKGKAAEIARCSDRTAHRILRLLEEIGAIDRVNDGPNAERYGLLTGIPAMKLKRHAGDRHLAAVADAMPSLPASEPLTDQSSAPYPTPANLVAAAATPDEPELPKEGDQHDPQALQSGWAEILETVRAEIDTDIFEAFILPLTPLSLSEGRVVLDAPNDIVAEQAKERLEGTRALAGRSVRFGRGHAPTSAADSTGSKSSPSAASPALSKKPQRDPTKPLRPVTETFCRQAARKLHRTYDELQRRGRRPAMKPEEVFRWAMYHVTYGKGAENTVDYSAHQALNGALSMLYKREFDMPSGFQPELVEGYVEAAAPDLFPHGANPYDKNDSNLRQECPKQAA